jgi:hypothetical protein
MPKVTVARNSQQDIKVRGLLVYFDGEQVADLRYGAEIEMDVEAGEHTLKVTNTLYTKQATFSIDAEEEARFVVGNRMPGIWTVMLVAIGVAPYKVMLERVG